MVENEGRLTGIHDLSSLLPRILFYSPYVKPLILLGLFPDLEDLSPDSSLWVLGARGSKEDPKRRKRGPIKVALR